MRKLSFLLASVLIVHQNLWLKADASTTDETLSPEGKKKHMDTYLDEHQEDIGNTFDRQGDVLDVRRLQKITKVNKKAGKAPKAVKAAKKGKGTKKPIVHVVTHATENPSPFWSNWKDGAETAMDDISHLKWDAVGYDSVIATKALENACSSSDAIIVTVPYEKGTEDYARMDDAINKCIDMGKPVFTANTDTYHNDRVYSYFGSSSYDMGIKCALAILFPSDTDVVAGRKAVPSSTNNNMDIQIYWDATSQRNEGARQILEGMQETFSEFDKEATFYYPTGHKDCPCVSEYPDGVPTDDETGLRMTIDNEVYEYPPKYGLRSCSRWDKNMIPSCHGSNPPDFCNDNWCYVDVDNCVGIKTEREGQYNWTDYENKEWAYSYDTCGEENAYVDFVNNNGDTTSDGGGTAAVLIEEGKQTVIINSDWGSVDFKFPEESTGAEKNVFLCGDEDVINPEVPQYGQSAFSQGVMAVSAAAAAARAIARETDWKALKGNAAAASSSNSFNALSSKGTFQVCVEDTANGNAPVPGAKVQCWDEDSTDNDDKIGREGVTGTNGCYTVAYDHNISWDYGLRGNEPDIYCEVAKNGKTWQTPCRVNHDGNPFTFQVRESIPPLNTVKVCLKSSSFYDEPVSGAHVQCWDDDNNSMGTAIGEKGMTGDDGCYLAKFDPFDVGDPWQIRGSDPDVYCEVNYLGDRWETIRAEGVNIPVMRNKNFEFTPLRKPTKFRSKIKESLSEYGKAIVEMFERYNVQVGDTWDVFGDAEFENDWIVQHPPTEYFGKSSKELPVPKMCGQGETTPNCDPAFQFQRCGDDSDCGAMKICPGPLGKLYNCENNEKVEHYANGTCKPIHATRTSASSTAQKLCVGHSYSLYDRMYDVMIEAEEFVDILSLGSPKLAGSTEKLVGTKLIGEYDMQFRGMFRNAIQYLHNKDRAITVKFLFGSIPNGNEDLEQFLKDLLGGLTLTNTKLNIYASTYRVGLMSWNHGKIVAVDGKKVLTGGSNFAGDSYLREDPAFDVNIEVSNGPALGAHKYAARLWLPVCKWAWQGTGTSHVQVAWYDKSTRQVKVDWGLDDCPPVFDSENRYPGKTGAMVIQAARLGTLAADSSHEGAAKDVGKYPLRGGMKTSDLAVVAMMDKATESIKLSQQDMLPLLLDGIASNPGTSWSGYGCGSPGCSGMTSGAFDDVWRKIGSVVKAASRGVQIYIMVSGPCAQAGGDPNDHQGLGPLHCPVDGTQGGGFDYWTDVLNYHNGWPGQRPMDQMHAHITEGMSPLGSGPAASDMRKLGGGNYGYGWSLNQVADWLFAYYAIHKETRPTNDDDGTYMNAEQVADYICKNVFLGHVRVKADEETYMRPGGRGGQIGNHAKVIMVDDEIFYIGSDNFYSAGLAEFGLIVDDPTKAADFAKNYFGTLWTEAAGVDGVNLVTGATSGECKWKDSHKQDFRSNGKWAFKN